MTALSIFITLDGSAMLQARVCSPAASMRETSTLAVMFFRLISLSTLAGPWMVALTRSADRPATVSPLLASTLEPVI